ncbi:hypothetical protein EG68_10985 [Paragonimus skrjabini miyazakii]|uniref:Sulfhydryl oxidase n=1 Tax=Paragonimus skrjabini miyazakii TaxID=59628 RepID=A0A8S9YLD4_9TREM|nr:hypothetical protein EG68_10985 [Paragonimus skrjabini miyazakii]
MSNRHSERFAVNDDEDDIYNPKSKEFCQACVDVSTFASLRGGKKWLEARTKLNMSKFPPKLDSRDALSGWLCMQHNLVNQKIHKPIFDCSRVLERWRYGWKDGSCNLPDLD